MSETIEEKKEDNMDDVNIENLKIIFDSNNCADPEKIYDKNCNKFLFPSIGSNNCVTKKITSITILIF